MKNLKQITTNDPEGTESGAYNNIEAGFSVKAKKKYCDFTGLLSKYQDPKTKLQYCRSEFFRHIQQLPESSKDEYLSLRRANVVLK